jgi:DNA polymerase elongation subunit (family B)
MTTKKKKPEFRLFDFQVENTTYDTYNDEEGQDNNKFLVKMFGMDEKGKTYCIYVKGFEPFFYVLVPDNWKKKEKVGFKQWLIDQLAMTPGGERYENSITYCKFQKGKKLYGFDNFKNYKFLEIGFKNQPVLNKVRNLWYNNEKNFKNKTLKKKGLNYKDEFIKLYEGRVPPLLRYFHIQDISPSGWVTFDNYVKKIKLSEKKTNCNYEYETTWDNIIPNPEKESATPMKIMSWDIEASSSHGDFPVAKKSYRKMIGEVIQYWTKNKKMITKMNLEQKKKLLIDLIKAAYRYKKMDGISRVYLQNRNQKPSEREVVNMVSKIINYKLGKLLERRKLDEGTWFEKNKWENMDDEERKAYRDWDLYIPWEFKKNDILYCLSAKFDAGKKLDILDTALKHDETWIKGKNGQKGRMRSNKIIPGILPKLEGDNCTFIGSTFLKLGEKEPYYNNMIVLNKCDNTPEVPNSEIVWKKKERNVLLEWGRLIKKEDPDIIIGYNTFGFDWHFLLDRADELDCKDPFLKLMSRNKFEKRPRDMIVKSTTTVASGTYELEYVKIPGRIQIDLYNYFRKNENLPAYKLDYVASHFIGDIVKGYEVNNKKTRVTSKNLMGLKNGHYIVFEILGHSSDKYKEGKKFKISNLQKDSFEVNYKLDIDKGQKFRWCLAKDDVTPQDIFRLTNEGPSSKAIVAKYCFQDCNLVHNLMIKNDIYTAMVEQAKICSVPIEFIAMRGQGIKLLSFIAKECRKINTFMPDLPKIMSNDGYEGAIVLPPKVGLYRDNPVAVNDYSSLYPSCMISENISHDTKVWTKEYNLEGDLIKIWGERDEKGNFKYDNAINPETGELYKYVDIEYDTYKYVRKNPKSAAQKIKCGRKMCRYVQFEGEKKGIMPTVLRELLASRKATRKLIKFKTVTLKNGENYSGLLNKGEEEYTIIPEKGDKIVVKKNDVENIEDTYNDFMKNVFDKRQLSKKVVANSLYGQSGAKTSAFYDKDIAASTTATGRKLLLYAKRIVEECYENRIVDTKNHGKVRTRSEYIYGDTDSVFFTFNLEELDGTKILGKKALEITIELAIQAGELATMFLKNPHDLEYEKTFMPFLLLSKKRYVGMLYETNPNKCKMKSMGIVLKRRDNAPCVKDCYGQVVDLLMSGKSADIAADFVKSYIKDMVDEKIGLEKLIISKSLNGFYKNPDSIAHKVLADRMAKRDPGNKPSVGSRIPFVYIQTKGEVKLQGDRVENPDYIKKKKLKPDYSFYITNQIMKPVTQIFNLLLEQMITFNKNITNARYKKDIRIIEEKYKDDRKKILDKTTALRDKMVKKIIFEDSLRKSDNAKKGQRSISSFFGTK